MQTIIKQLQKKKQRRFEIENENLHEHRAICRRIDRDIRTRRKTRWEIF